MYASEHNASFHISYYSYSMYIGPNPECHLHRQSMQAHSLSSHGTNPQLNLKSMPEGGWQYLFLVNVAVLPVTGLNGRPLNMLSHQTAETETLICLLLFWT